MEVVVPTSTAATWPMPRPPRGPDEAVVGIRQEPSAVGQEQDMNDYKKVKVNKTDNWNLDEADFLDIFDEKHFRCIFVLTIVLI
jgi:hypothetical protein